MTDADAARIEAAIEREEMLRTTAELLDAAASEYGLERFAAGASLRWRIPGAGRSILLLYPSERGVELNLNRLYRHGFADEAERLTALMPPLRNPGTPLYPRIAPEELVEHFDAFSRDVLPTYVQAHEEITNR